MDCTKAWDLMMKKVDVEASPVEEQKLSDHLTHCQFCTQEYHSLQFALQSIKDSVQKAPAFIEKAVMSELNAIRQKNRLKLLPYVLMPLVGMVGLLVLFVVKFLRGNPLSIMDETAKVISFAYKLVSSVGAVITYFSKVFYLKELFFVTTILGAVGLVFYLLKYAKRESASEINWRASK